jgi:ABC-type nickel/cobalt efflux system permease component RcnA
MEYYEVDAMLAFTAGLGLTTFIMALEILAIALKAWAAKREQPPQLTYRFP